MIQHKVLIVGNPALKMQTGLLNAWADGGSGLSAVLHRQVWGTLWANTVSSIAAGIGIFILTVNLKKSSAFIYNCQEVYGEDFCFMACFSTVCITCGELRSGSHSKWDPSFPFLWIVLCYNLSPIMCCSGCSCTEMLAAAPSPAESCDIGVTCIEPFCGFPVCVSLHWDWSRQGVVVCDEMVMKSGAAIKEPTFGVPVLWLYLFWLLFNRKLWQWSCFSPFWDFVVPCPS